MIRVTDAITIDEDEIQLDFIRSSGPGGQNVNKVATGVQLRFDIRNSPSLSAEVRERLVGLAGRRVTADGVLVITARRYRTQGANRHDAIHRLIGLIRRAAQEPKPRKETKPTAASKRQRMDQKRRRAQVKQTRRPAAEEDD